MSHNSKYYLKKLKATDSKSTPKIDVLFRQSILKQSEKPADDPANNNPPVKTVDACSTVTCDQGQGSPSPPVSTTVTSDSESDDQSTATGCSVGVPDARLFVSSKYEHKFEWLYYSAAKSGYCCKLCELFSPILPCNKLNPFVNGVALGDHPMRKLLKHQSSKPHDKALSKYTAQNTSSGSVLHLLQRAADAQQSAEVERNRNYMTCLVKTINFIVNKRWAIDSVSDLMNHIAELGTSDVTKYMDVHPNLKYTSSTSTTDLVKSIADVIESNLLKSLKESNCFALLADESTDEAHREQFAILARFSYNGEVKDHYIGLIEVRKTDAESLMKAIETFLIAKGIDLKKAMFVGFDGCNTMSGVNTGLQRRFRHLVPHQIYLNCRNHKLALCVKHLIKDYPVIGKVDGMLLSIWKMFYYSPKKYGLFKHVQETYGLKHLPLIRAATTRWLSHGRACKRLVERYVQVIDTLDATLDDKYDPEVFGVREILLEKNNMATVLILCDMLAPVIIFSDFLQGNNDFAIVVDRTKVLIHDLEHLEARYRAHLQAPDPSLALSKMDGIFGEIDDRNDLARRLRGGHVYTPRQVVEELACPMIKSLIKFKEIQDSFHCSPVLAAFSIFHLPNVPEDVAELADYGQAEIQELASHYGNTKRDIFMGHHNEADVKIAEESYIREFQAFKHQMFMFNI